MDIRRLRFVEDICPLAAPAVLPPYDATRWGAEAQMSAEDVLYRDNGFVTTVFQNPLFSWYRSFSTDNNPVPPKPSRSLIQIDEWVPGFGNDIKKHGYYAFGAPRRHGIAEIPLTGPVEMNWSTNAKRHLKTFRKQDDVSIRLGTYRELETPYGKSTVPRAMRSSMWRLTGRHLTDHPETIDVLIAESKKHGIVAGFVAGNCTEASTSYYLLGFYLKGARESQAMTGLIAEWFERSRQKDLKTVNFGDMCGPRPLPFQQDRGYSLFKTHFGVRRTHHPGSHWKIRFGL